MIVGAGLAGLIAGHIFPGEIHEAAATPGAMHKALLRFRTQEVARVTGIDFMPVTVRKGIWSFVRSRFVEPNIQLANQYSAKCLNGWLANDRSIWYLDPVARYIAPEDLYERLVDNLDDRISWNSRVNFSDLPPELPVISTVPMDIVLRDLGITPPDLTFNRAPIHVQRYRVPNCDLYQTVYYPEVHHDIYRASITKDLLIVESTLEGGSAVDTVLGMKQVCESFGIAPNSIQQLDGSNQRYGKIASIDDFARKQLLGRLTNEHNIFSLGRFATWRNILLDDVVNDAMVIKKLIKATAYDRQLHLHK